MINGEKMKFSESEALELKTFTAELDEAVISISAILNKHQKGELYLGIRNNGEKWGGGLKFILEKEKDSSFKDVAGIFTVTFKRGELGGENMGEAREKTVEKILELIRQNNKITQEEIMKTTGLSRRGVEWNLSNLKQQGIIRRVGPDKGGHWEIVNCKKEDK